jgi:hypothetical protein
MNSRYPDMVDKAIERTLTAVPSRHGCDLETLRECIEAIHTVTQVALHARMPAWPSKWSTNSLGLIFNLALPGRARLFSSFGVSARQGAATA